MNDHQPIVGDIRMIWRDNEGLYRLWTGDKWATFDDPAIDDVFDLMGVEPPQRVAMREYYLSKRLPIVDKAVADFARVCKQQGLDLDYERDKP